MVTVFSSREFQNRTQPAPFRIATVEISGSVDTVGYRDAVQCRV